MKEYREKSKQSKRATRLPVPTDEAKAPVGNVPTAEHIARVKSLTCEVTGIAGEHGAERLFGQLAILLWGATEEERKERVLAALDIMMGFRPANVVEAMLTVQMVGVHEAALRFLRCATGEGQTFEGADANVLRATRLMRLYNEQLEAMAKLKGKAGQQKVRVEHVHVYPGGQAIVGSVTPGNGTKS